jgi:hypothetical protein
MHGVCVVKDGYEEFEKCVDYNHFKNWYGYPILSSIDDNIYMYDRSEKRIYLVNFSGTNTVYSGLSKIGDCFGSNMYGYENVSIALLYGHATAVAFFREDNTGVGNIAIINLTDTADCHYKSESVFDQ